MKCLAKHTTSINTLLILSFYVFEDKNMIKSFTSWEEQITCTLLSKEKERSRKKKHIHFNKENIK